MNGLNGFLINHTFSGVGLGEAIASSDVNNDGVDDILITGRIRNEVFGIYGNETGFPAAIEISDLNDSSGFVVTGDETQPSIGGEINDVGDVNGDGIPDIGIGRNSISTLRPGVAYVLFGQNGNLDVDIQLSELDGSNGFRISRSVDPTRTQIGVSIASAGDVNQDGVDDFLVGDPNGEDVHVLFGRKSDFPSAIDVDSMTASEGFRIIGSGFSDTGHDVSSAGDFNGDGISDRIIGAPEFNTRGRAYIVFGKASDDIFPDGFEGTISSICPSHESI